MFYLTYKLEKFNFNDLVGGVYFVMNIVYGFIRFYRIPESNSDIKIEMMIGSNRPKALQPVGIIPCQDGGPYAMRSELGESICGPMMKYAVPINVNVKCKCSSFILRHMHSVRGAFNHLYSAPSQGRLRQCRLGFEDDTLRLLPLPSYAGT